MYCAAALQRWWIHVHLSSKHIWKCLVWLMMLVLMGTALAENMLRLCMRGHFGVWWHHYVGRATICIMSTLSLTFPQQKIDIFRTEIYTIFRGGWPHRYEYKRKWKDEARIVAEKQIKPSEIGQLKGPLVVVERNRDKRRELERLTYWNPQCPHTTHISMKCNAEHIQWSNV